MSKYFGIRRPNPRAGGTKRNPDDVTVGVVHIAVTSPTTQSALAVAEWQSTQNKVPSGYHSLFDSERHVQYFPDDRIAHGAGGGYNRRSIHISGACQVDTWARYENWATRCYAQMAPEVRRLRDERGIFLRVLTKAEVDRGLRGWTTHARLDPSRRSDPGAKVDGKGQFDFERLFTLAAHGEGPKPPPVKDLIIVNQLMLKEGDEGLLVRQLRHTVNAVIKFTGGGFDHLPITSVFDGALAERVQHAIWRAEGWVLGYPLYGEEEGGSRVTTKVFTDLQHVAHGLRSGMYDTNPDSSLTQSGVDLKNAKAVAELVRKNAS